MNGKNNRKRVDHSGSTFDSFLDDEGIRDEVEAVAIKRVLARQLVTSAMPETKENQTSNRRKQLHTSRSQLDRLLDPSNVSVSLHTITRAARVLGKRGVTA